MQRATALRARLGEWVGESKTRRAQLSAISTALDDLANEPAAVLPHDAQVERASQLGRLAMEFNELLMAHVMTQSFRLADDIVEWQERRESRYWFLWEKYFLSPKREPLALEAKRKATKLQHLQRNLTALLGAGSRLVDMYTGVLQQEDPDSLLKVICTNEKVIRICFGVISRVMQDDTVDISNSLSQQNFTLPAEACTWKEAHHALQLNVAGFPDFIETIEQVVQAFGRPLYFVAHWMHYSAYSFAGYTALKYVSQNRVAILDTARNFRISARNFMDRYIVNPLVEMYRTIRYDKSSFHVIDPAEIQADEESLSRMIRDFLSTHKAMGGATDRGEPLKYGPRPGFNAVMPMYERAIEQPVRNAVFGDLFRLLLLQVQKGRVDAERALQALDKLLRSNELNFQMLAILPAVFVSYLFTSWTVGLIFRRSNRQSLHRKLQLEMRNVSRILTEAQSEQSGQFQGKPALSLIVTGSVLLSAQRIRILTDAKARALLYEDLQELEGMPLLSQKEAVVERMFRTHAFLWPRE